MGFNSFTPEQISELRSNKYTYKVTRKTIQFTIEFKERYIFERKQGVMPKKILYDAGYDPEVLGDNRISGISCMMNALIRSGKQPTEGQPKNKRMPPSNTDYLSMGQRDAIVAMQYELTYLRQEVEFLKKILEGQTTER